MKKCTLVALIILAAFSAAFAQKPTPVPTPEHFRMEIEDVFPIAGMGIVARGTIAQGKVKVGDEVDIVGLNPTKTTSVTGIIKPPVRERQTEAGKGDAVGIVLKGVTKDDLARGQVIAKTGTVKSSTKFKAKIDVGPTLVSGKRNPITTGYKPMIYIGLRMYSGVVTLAPEIAEVQPGTKDVVVEIEVEKPAALVIGQDVTFREGSRVIAKGTVTGFVDKK